MFLNWRLTISHLYVGYMLELNPDKRPDIFQVANVLFKLKGEKNPVPNVFVSFVV